jgi:folate-binding protein YgfZ
VSQLPAQGPVALFRTTTTVIEVSGADRLNYLNDVTTQNVKDSTIGTRTDALVLDGNGVVQAAFGIAVLAEHVLLLSPHDDVTTYILDVLAQRTFLLDARFTRTEQHVWELRGDTYEDAARSANLFAPAGTVRPSGTAVVVCGVAHGVEIVGHADAIETATHALTANGIPFGTEEDRQERRICRGEPGYGTEIVRPHLPEEAGVLPSHVHLAKGCYPGQEAVARMWMLGRPRRRLALLAVPTDTPVGVFAGTGRDTVDITSVAPTSGYALAYVPEATTAQQTFTGANGADATVVALVGADPNPPGHDPAMTRRRDRRADA